MRPESYILWRTKFMHQDIYKCNQENLTIVAILDKPQTEL